MDLIPRIDHKAEPGIAGLGPVVSLSRVGRAWRRGELTERRVQETMTTSDFAYMADLIDRQAMSGYLDEILPTSFEKLGSRRDSQTFGDATDSQLNAVKLIPRVAEKGEYKPIDPSVTSYTWHTYKFGCQFDVSWEAWLRDGRDLGLLQGYPANWGLSARYSMEHIFTSAYAGNTTFFAAGHNNVGTGVLNEANLEIGLNALFNQTDPSGNEAPYAGPVHLVVPPALQWTAKRLVNSTNIVISGTTDRAMANSYALEGAAEVTVNSLLPVIDTVNGDTGWYLFCDPRLRPAVRYGHVRGYENPEIFVRDSDVRALAGGAEDPFAGSFLDDDIAFKCRFTFGADSADFRGAYMSDGTV